MQCVYALILILAIFWGKEFAYTLETSTINTALLSHQWSTVCTQQTMPSDRNIMLVCSHCVSFMFAWGYCRLLFKHFCILCSVLNSGESRIIFLGERSSICQYPCKISAINVKKQSRARLLLTYPVLYILKIQKTYSAFWKPPFQNQPKSVRL